MPSIKVRKYVNSVYIIYSHGQQKFKIFTGAKVEDKFWNLCSPKKNCPNYENVIRQIDVMQTRIINASMKVRNMNIEPTVERVQAEFRNQITPEGPVRKSFFELYDAFLIIKGYKPSTLRKGKLFKSTLEHFCTFACYKMDIKTWDRVIYGQFIQHLLFHQKIADSTILRLVKGLKTFINFAYPDADMRWMKYKLLSSEEEVIALKKTELQYVVDADLGGYLEKTRDLFIFLATTGMRFSDSQDFDPNWVTEKDLLKFRQLKTGTWANPPLYEVSRRVLLKYDGVPPHISNQRFNEYLKELFAELKLNRPITTHIIKNRVVLRKVEPLSTVVSSHTGRRTFITLALNAGIPIQIVMRMSGHSDYKSMRPYMRKDEDEIKRYSKRLKVNPKQ